jgi:hypothetical protein
MSDLRQIGEWSLNTTRDDLANSLETSFKLILLETGDWRPLADHVLSLVGLAVSGEREANGKKP